MDLPNGIQGCIDHQQRVIWVAKNLTAVERRCTEAFEIGQLLQGPTSLEPCLAAAQRRAAEEWAAQMLLPTEEFLEGFRVSFDLREIAAYLDVDLPTLRTRIRCGTDEEQDRIMATIEAFSAHA
jgi:Zn-dependent peptidase ImmA (M78 family)